MKRTWQLHTVQNVQFIWISGLRDFRYRRVSDCESIWFKKSTLEGVRFRKVSDFERLLFRKVSGFGGVLFRRISGSEISRFVRVGFCRLPG